MGDQIEVVARPGDHEVTIALMNQITLYERHRAGELVVAPIAERWRTWALDSAA